MVERPRDEALKMAYSFLLIRWVDAVKREQKRRGKRLYVALEAMRTEWPDIAFEQDLSK